MKEKQALESAKTVFGEYMTKAMAKRNDEWEDKKRAFVATKLGELKDAILEHARSELQKDVNKQLIAQKAIDRAARDRAIAEKKRADGTNDEIDNYVGNGGDAGAAATEGWSRGARRAAPGSPDKGGKPAQEGRARPPVEDFAIKRSDKPRNTRPEEESKQMGSGFTRAPREEPADTGFVRGNFRTRKEEPKADDVPKRGPRPAAAQKDGDSGAGFGFRSTNASRGGGRGRGRN